MVKIEINFTNRWLYTFALIIGIFALGIGVYAVSHPNPGHEIWEINADLCRSDGTNCKIGNFNINVGLFQNNDEICYTSSTALACVTQTDTCPASSTTLTESVFGFPDCAAFQSLTSPGGRDAQCMISCSGDQICTGDTTQFSCGATSVGYTSGSFTDCTDIDLFEIEVECSCSAPAQTYQKEFPSTGLLCLQKN